LLEGERERGREGMEEKWNGGEIKERWSERGRGREKDTDGERQRKEQKEV
jgi:hypothetical protein